MVTINDTVFVFWIAYTLGLVFNLCSVMWSCMFYGDDVNSVSTSYHKKRLITIITCVIYITPIISTCVAIVDLFNIIKKSYKSQLEFLEDK